MESRGPSVRKETVEYTFWAAAGDLGPLSLYFWRESVPRSIQTLQSRHKGKLPLCAHAPAISFYFLLWPKQ